MFVYEIEVGPANFDGNRNKCLIVVDTMDLESIIDEFRKKVILYKHYTIYKCVLLGTVYN